MDDKSKKYAVIGDPIAHSLSPKMHQAALDDLNINATYTACQVTTDQLADFFKDMRLGAFDGVNVTIPHKEQLLSLVDEVSPLAKQVGAINTVYLNEGKLIGENTDGLGYVKSLLSETDFEFSNQSVTVIGCGGASKAICHVLLEYGITNLTLVNRTRDRAIKLKDNLIHHHPKTQITVITFDEFLKLDSIEAKLLINTTSLGLTGKDWSSLDFLSKCPKDCLVSDIVYNPKETPLLIKAQQQGLKIHYGLGMLINQGAVAFELFTNQTPNVQVMRTAIDS